MRLIFFLLLSLPMVAQDRAWKISVVAFATSTALDAQSSWGSYEMNPIVGRGQFGPRQSVAVAGISAGALAFEYLVLRKHPRYGRVLTWTNFAVAGAHIGAAARNYRIPGGSK